MEENKHLTNFALSEVRTILQGLKKLLKSDRHSDPDTLTRHHLTDEENQEAAQCVDLPFWLFYKMSNYARSRWETLLNRRYFSIQELDIVPKDPDDAWDEANWYAIYKNLVTADVAHGYKAEILIAVPSFQEDIEPGLTISSIDPKHVHQLQRIFVMEHNRLVRMKADPDTMPPLCSRCHKNIPVKDGSICVDCYLKLKDRDIPEGYMLFDFKGVRHIRLYRKLAKLTGIPVLIDDKLIDQHGKRPKINYHRFLLPEKKADFVLKVLAELDKILEKDDLSWECGLPMSIVNEHLPGLIKHFRNDPI